MVRAACLLILIAAVALLVAGLLAVEPAKIDAIDRLGAILVFDARMQRNDDRTAVRAMAVNRFDQRRLLGRDLRPRHRDACLGDRPRRDVVIEDARRSEHAERATRDTVSRNGSRDTVNVPSASRSGSRGKSSAE